MGLGHLEPFHSMGMGVKCLLPGNNNLISCLSSVQRREDITAGNSYLEAHVEGVGDVFLHQGF